MNRRGLFALAGIAVAALVAIFTRRKPVFEPEETDRTAAHRQIAPTPPPSPSPSPSPTPPPQNNEPIPGG